MTKNQNRYYEIVIKKHTKSLSHNLKSLSHKIIITNMGNRYYKNQKSSLRNRYQTTYKIVIIQNEIVIREDHYQK